MRGEPNLRVDKHRVAENLWESPPGVNWGCFQIGELKIISSGTPDPNGDPVNDWEHVSVSHRSRCPTWGEMCSVKKLFWRDDETVMQFHPRGDSYVNDHEFCLHMWRQIGVQQPLPPRSTLTVG